MLRISIIGTRGIPAHYGGFETFAEEISTRLVQSGYSVTVQCDYSEVQPRELYGVNLYYSPVTKSGHPLRYYFDGILRGLRSSDIILVAGTGGSVFYFLNIFHQKIIITNTDGIESGRLKWSIPKRLYVKLSEILAVWSSDHLIADSEAVSEYLAKRYPRSKHKMSVAEYGAEVNNGFDSSVHERLKIEPWKYYLVVSRIEPENNIGTIIEGFLESKTEHPLIIVGPVVNTRYCNSLVNKFGSSRVRFIGGIYDKKELNSLRFACRAYFHGHSVGGTNPSLLEAMANGNITICHDNLFNREVTSESQYYFGDKNDVTISIHLVEALTGEETMAYRSRSRERIKTYYNWDNILIKYSGIFKKFLPGKAE